MKYIFVFFNNFADVYGFKTMEDLEDFKKKNPDITYGTRIFDKNPFVDEENLSEIDD